MTRSAYRSASSVARNVSSSSFSFRAAPTSSSSSLASCAIVPCLGNLDTPSSFTPTTEYWGPSAKSSKNAFARQERQAAPRTGCSSRTDGKVNQLRQPTVQEKSVNPRRASLQTGDGCVQLPSLVRQADRKNDFVDNLVDFAARTVAVIWPDADETLPPTGTRCVTLDLRTFIQETLRRSRTSYSTLQVALYYLILVKEHVPRDCHSPTVQDRALQSGRRMFLAALILASKYLQDRNYSARAWSRISGLPITEININEMAFLTAVNWKLHLSDSLFNRWIQVVLTSVKNPTSLLYPSARMGLVDSKFEWHDLVKLLTPGLEGVYFPPENTSGSVSEADVLSPLSPAREDMFEAYSSRRSSFSSASSSRTVTPQPISALKTATLPPPRPMEPSLRSQASLGMSLSNASLSSERLTPRSSAMGGAMAMARNVAMTGCASENWNFISRSETPTLMVTSPSSVAPQIPGPPRRSSLSVCSSASSPDSLFSVTSRSSSISSASSMAGSFYAATADACRKTKIRLQCETQRLNPLQRMACTAREPVPFTSSPTSSPERSHPKTGSGFPPMRGPSPTQQLSKSIFSAKWTSSAPSRETSPHSDDTPKGFKGRKRSRTNMDECQPTPSPTTSVMSSNSVSSSPMLYQSLSSSTASLLAPPSLSASNSALLPNLEASAMDVCVSPQDYSNMTTGMTPQIQMQLQLQTPSQAPHSHYPSILMSPGSFRESKRACCAEEASFFMGSRKDDMTLSAL